MLIGAQLHELDSSFSTYHYILATIVCNPPAPGCYLNECQVYPEIESVRQEFYSIFDKNLIDLVTFKQWTAVDRSSLETVSQQSDDLIETFCEKLEAHSFIASQQSKFFDESKSSLKPDEIICADFWENYAFILQCSAHGFLWNNAQATIHPFVTYYRESDSSQYNNLTF